jgi:hypothetical protein
MSLAKRIGVPVLLLIAITLVLTAVAIWLGLGPVVHSAGVN